MKKIISNSLLVTGLTVMLASTTAVPTAFANSTLSSSSASITILHDSIPGAVITTIPPSQYYASQSSMVVPDTTMKTIGSYGWNYPYGGNNAIQVYKDTFMSSYLQLNIVQIANNSGVKADANYSIYNSSGDYLSVRVQGDADPLNPPLYVYNLEPAYYTVDVSTNISPEYGNFTVQESE